MRIKDPVRFLNIFAEWVRTGLLAAKGIPIQKRSVDQYLRSVGKIFIAVGITYPRLNTLGGLDFSL